VSSAHLWDSVSPCSRRTDRHAGALRYCITRGGVKHELQQQELQLGVCAWLTRRHFGCEESPSTSASRPAIESTRQQNGVDRVGVSGVSPRNKKAGSVGSAPEIRREHGWVGGGAALHLPSRAAPRSPAAVVGVERLPDVERQALAWAACAVDRRVDEGAVPRLTPGFPRPSPSQPSNKWSAPLRPTA